MKISKYLKIGVFFSLLFIFSNSLFAQDFILSDDGLVDERAKEKINQIGNESKSKLGVNIYIYVKSNLGLKENLSTKEKIDYIKNYENQIIQSLNKPYVLLTSFIEDTHVNLNYSGKYNSIMDKDDILNGYVVPLLASKDKNTLFAKVSAAMLNGYSAIAEVIAEDKKIKLESNIGNQGKVSSTIWRVFMYFLVFGGLLLYTYAVLKKRK